VRQVNYPNNLSIILLIQKLFWTSFVTHIPFWLTLPRFDDEEPNCPLHHIAGAASSNWRILASDGGEGNSNR
jgi:hypothetical protein